MSTPSIPVTTKILQDVQGGNRPNTGENGTDIGPLSADIDGRQLGQAGTSDFPDQPQSTALSIGVEKERVDPTTLALIHALFGERGIEFLSLALRQAVIKQLSLPDLEAGVADVAVISTPNLRALAKAMGWCYDAVDKYVLLFSAVLLFRKQRSRSGGTELYFPLAPYHLPDAAETKLSKLYQMRPKVASLARKVARRLPGLTPKASSPLIESPRVSQKVARFDLDGAIADVEALLAQVLSATQQKEILPQIERTLRYRCRLIDGDFGDLASSEQVSSGNFLPVSEVLTLSTSSPSSINGATFAQGVSSGVQEKLPVGSEVGNFLPVSEVLTLSTSSPSSINGATFAQGVSSGVQEKLPVGSEVGNFLPASPEAAFPETGDFSEDLTEHGQLSPQTLEKLPKTGDFHEATAASLNVNVIYTSNNITNKDDNVNDDPTSDRYTPKEAGQIGQQLAHFLEKSPQNIGGFVNKAKQCTRTMIRAAVVDTLVHTAFPTVDPGDERGRPKHRGRWFHDACNKYNQRGSHIPASVLKWLRTDLSWQEIEQELNAAATAYQSYMVAGGNTADLVRGYLRGEIDKQGLDQALQQAVKPEVVTGATGSVRPTRMIEWKGRMVPEEQAYREGYYGGFERFKPSDHPLDDLAARVKYYQSIGKLPTFPPAETDKGEQP